MHPFRNKIAVVTGASRNGGRGIALALGEAGATVYITGRSIRGTSTTDNPTNTIDDTAEMITVLGGRAIPVQVDHTNDEQVAAFFERVQREQGRLDILVSNAWGGYELMDGFEQKQPFWELPLRQWELMYSAGLRAHLITSRHAMSLMLPQKCGLIVHTTTSIHPLRSHVGHQFYEPIKVAINRLSFCMAQDCQPYGIAVIALSLGDEKLFMRTWDLDSEEAPDAPYHTFSPAYVGRAVVALASDKNILHKTGPIPYLEVPALAREYGFTDIDGRQP